MRKNVMPLLVLITLSAIGVIMYTFYENKKQETSGLLLENVESLTNEENDPLENEYITCFGEAKWDVVGIETYYFTENYHDQSSSDNDFYQDYVMSCCIASGKGSKIGRNSPPVATIAQGKEKHSDCKVPHQSLDEYVSLITSLIY